MLRRFVYIGTARTCLVIASLLLANAKFAAAAMCFDFGSKVTLSLPQPIDSLQAGDVSRSGHLPTNGVWGAARGVVAKPIKEVFEKFLDPSTVKDPQTQKLEVQNLPKPHFKAFKRVKVTINPLRIFTASWTEDWAYMIEEGNDESPKVIRILYQKIEGTSHIEHLCGSIMLREIKAGITDVSLYEEVKATRRSAEDTARGHLGTLSTLRK